MISRAKKAGPSDQHFTAAGPLIEAWASMKRFVRKDGADPKKVQAAKADDPSNPTVDFRGAKRSNATHQSTTDPDCVLDTKAAGPEAKLCFGAHVLMDNGHGLCADLTVHHPIATTEAQVALAQLDPHQEFHEGPRPQSVGADKNYHQKDFGSGCRERGIAPHVACQQGVKVEGLDGRTTGSKGCQTSLKLRKRVEEIFGWMKTVGGLAQSRSKGIDRNQAWADFVAASYKSAANGSPGGGLTWIECAPLGAR